MDKKHNILSTKVLTTVQKKLFSNKIKLIEKDFVSIDFINFKIPSNTSDLVIFTSQNAVRATAAQIKEIEQEIVCVGKKTAQLIHKLFHKKPLIITDNSEQLAKEIIKTSYKSILFFNGNLRKKELPAILKSNQIHLEEVMVYKTQHTPSSLSNHFDGILFFSPSGVESYLKNNMFSKNTTIFAIGYTTANYIKQNGGKCIVPKESTIECLIEQINQYFNKK